MNAFAPDTSPDGIAQEPPPLDKPAGEAAPAPEESWREHRSPLDGIEEGMRADQLESLGWLRRYGMEIAERLDRCSRGLLLFKEEPAFKDVDVALAFSRVAKAVRQIIVVEQETAGLREMRVPRAVAERAAPAEPQEPEFGAQASRIDRDADLDHEDLRDRNDIDDYSSAPVQEIMTGVRAELDALPGAQIAACQMAGLPMPDLEPVIPTPFDPGERLPGETGEAYHQRLLAARIQALEAKYGTGPP